jgi:hypothetical protein
LPDNKPQSEFRADVLDPSSQLIGHPEELLIQLAHQQLPVVGRIARLSSGRTANVVERLSLPRDWVARSSTATNVLVV